MADKEQLEAILQGKEVWNKWRAENPEKKVDLHKADLREADLRAANLREADLSEANLRESSLRDADLMRANLRRANLIAVDLRAANLREADLNSADLGAADLLGTDLRGADIRWAKLNNASLVETNLEGANLTGCSIYGISVWGVELKGAKQSDLIITPDGESSITVDDLEVAQFIYLLLYSDKMRRVIDTITSKTVLILGRFTPERKAILDAIRNELRKRDYVPLLFDFEKPASRDLTETISTLAHMARFIIADITEPKSIPAELRQVVPDLPSVPVMPLVLRSDSGYALFEHIRRYPWVLEPYQYANQEDLLATLGEKVIALAEAKVKEIRELGKYGGSP